MKNLSKIKRKYNLHCNLNCKWLHKCKKLDKDYTSQRIFYCLNTIDLCHKNIHWKKRATYSFKPHHDNWDNVKFSLNFSNPTFRIAELKNICDKAKQANIAIPFLFLQKPLSYIKSQTLITKNESHEFNLPSRLESSFAYSLYLSEEVSFLRNAQEKCKSLYINENDYLYFISALISSGSPKKLFDSDIKSYINNAINNYTENNIHCNNFLLKKYNIQQKRLCNIISSKTINEQRIKLNEVVDNIELSSVLPITDLLSRFNLNIYNFSNSMFPIQVLIDYYYIKSKYDNNSFSISSLINDFIKISTLYLEFLINQILYFLKSPNLFENDDIININLLKVNEINFFFDLIDKSYPVLVPINNDMHDGKIIVELLSETKAKTYNDLDDSTLQKIFKKIDESKILSFLLNIFIRTLYFPYIYSLSSAESVNVNVEILEAGYRMKEPYNLSDFYNRYKYKDNLLQLSTRKKRKEPPYLKSPICNLNDSKYKINVGFRLGKSLYTFLGIMVSFSFSIIFFGGDSISYFLGGIIPIIVIIATSFSIGRWSLMHRLVKPHKILFAFASIILLVKILLSSDLIMQNKKTLKQQKNYHFVLTKDR